MILCLLPIADYDPTESGVPWQRLRDAGIEVRFATPDGVPAHADRRLTEIGFGLFNPFFMTRDADLLHYRQMSQSPSFQKPLAFADVRPEQFEGLLVPGGHAKGMRTLLESTRATEIVQHFFAANKPVAAVCHGVLLLARTRDAQTGKSVLYGRKTTALPSNMELLAWYTTAAFLGRYYRTYPQSVEAEVKAALAKPQDFARGPLLPRREASANSGIGFTVRDGNYLSARWPGDCHTFAEEFVKLVMQARKAHRSELPERRGDEMPQAR
jgi:putative intracellular protease/amidase